MTENDVFEPVTAMTPADFLCRFGTIVDAYVSAARAAELALDTCLEALFNEPSLKKLAEEQPHLVRAIGEAEMVRMAKALPK